jgi:hypothetical protein
MAISAGGPKRRIWSVVLGWSGRSGCSLTFSTLRRHAMR